MKTKGKPLSIYLHIPFCARKCLYCDFLSAPADDVTKARYVESLITEIKAEAPKYEAYEVRTVFIGGGTPSILPAEAIVGIMDTLKEQFCFAKEAEITIEVNPGSAEAEKLLAYYRSGINRLSIGLQSSHNSELQQLGRIHTYQDFLRTYRDAVKSGFNNINIDLMSAIPGQTTESYRETLRQILHLSPMPAHISAYSLIIEEGTPFYENTPELPDEEADREMYKITDDMLSGSGFERYEISNYARKGYACKHNKVYWRRGDYVGFGIGAASLIDNVRFHNDD
ncbi:MAG: radical SAM family heme chaperone HemW, partial [Lachnospiraceae bacterium]|nr:radical SAM family heme chaperone HemW [Lachnospiraceae bacterium]